ncbi:MAG: recombinase family protein [Lachnospiraceae bacterium]|nr:recombinase family protein [Lachnospiraceae bacterium]
MNKKQFLAAMYLRLSRDDSDVGDITDRDGTLKSESNSIGNQRELIRAFIHEQQDIDLFDIYVDDGFSGSNFDRPEFKRMISDIEAGKVNCVIVKDLSRFGRDYIESGRYIQKVFPALSVRFIALTDHYDSFQADVSESGIVLPVKNFINDSYCRDISTKVKSQFEVKRKNGECIAAFAPYGYKKAQDDKSRLVIDEYAADVVRKIFAWKIEGMAVSAVAEKLNGLGILSPKEYKKSTGDNYKGGFSGAVKSQWSSSTVKRILTNETYLGHMVQGKREKINYKLKKSVDKPQEEWIKVENTHEAVIPEDQFQVVQNLLKTDGRVSPVTEENSLFTGILFCGDCGEQMVRRVNRYKNSRRVYYICSTKNRGEGCSRHSIEEEQLKGMAAEMVRHYANCFLEEKRIFQKVLDMETNFESIVRYDTEIARLKEEQDRYYSLCSGLYEDLKQGIITKEEFERLHGDFKRKAAEFEDAQKKQEGMIKELFKSGVISAARLKTMQDCSELKEIDRHTLCSMVKRITVFEDQRMDIEFYYMNQYCVMQDVNKKMEGQKAKECKTDNRPGERSA